MIAVGVVGVVAALAVGAEQVLTGGSHAHAAEPAPPLPYHFFIAHRAAGSYLAPENTAAAFEAGIADPDANLLEFDIQILKDGGAGIWHDLAVNRITPETGPVADRTTKQFKKLRIDSHTWFGGGVPDMHPLMLDQVLDRYARRKTLLAHPKDAAAADAVVKALIKRGLTRTVQMQTNKLSIAEKAKKAGVTTQMVIGTPEEAAAASPAAVKAAGVSRVSLESSLPDSLIASYAKAGLIVACFDVASHTRRDQLYRIGVRGIDSDDPAYMSGDARFQSRRDPFARGTYWPGLLGQTQTSAAMTQWQRGRLSGPDWWTIPGNRTFYARQGWNVPLGKSYTLHAQVRFDTLSPDHADDAGIDFAAPVDGAYTASVPGYDALLHENGRLDLYRVDASGKRTLLKSTRTAPVQAGHPADLTIHVTPKAIAVQRGTAKLLVADSTYRGPNLYLGRDGGPEVSYRDVSIS
ncbi:glycerophosphodiester phosphodiesterase [Actinomadura rupiterrae]|uniref:glycerophosphodiester phosphodiesterase n=1 Tax=Actinomadura rupiterrae TaxID=559627 RepID=UPI0020A2A2DD|nr:glycerophosphodiester phosphodiesterase family protein [Actinomadura rupiterrae]MCP2338872.1 glycerophosphoryl diester phosphodiesterase [Actinomadura rupiterrae]